MSLILLRFAMKNLLRRKLRTFVTASGVAIGVAALFTLVSFQRGYQAGLQTEMDRLGAQVLVVPKGCPYDAASIALHGASWPCYLKTSYLAAVAGTPHVAVAAPVLMNALFDQHTGAQIVYCGVQRNILALKRQWRIAGTFPTRTGQLLVGSGMAHDYRWSLGERVTLPGLDPIVHGTVTGLLAPTSGADDQFVYMSLASAQSIFQRPDQLTHILVRLDDPSSMDSVVANLRGCDAGLDMNVVPLAHLFRTIQDLVQSTQVVLGSIALVALLAAGAGVSNTVLMAVAERTREIGVLRAIGSSKGLVFTIIWIETITMCLAGAIAGVGLAISASGLVEQWLRERLPFSPDVTLIHPELGVILLCVGGSAVLGTFAALLPALRAARLTPSSAMGTAAI